ncbi:hypothetical protein K440DRAFT_599902 [Wilcoxina mikolae CBS 423.85]|nr:hypothetical protein K440DRAFT_599902 [Wilcoxina mikolae CBS 423.85]
MAEVLAVPVQLDGCSQSVQNRCSSLQLRNSRHETTIPRTHLDNYEFDSSTPHKLSPATSTTSSTQLSSISYSPQSSLFLPSMSSNICLETRPMRDDTLFFPIYDFGTLSQSPSPEPLPSSTADADTDCPRLKSSSKPVNSDSLVFLGKATDDTFLRREPSRHVDYLSHDWQEEDIWASWRYMVGNRKVHSNASRLENASWRTWAQKMNHLRTVSADKLNWMKDCDVTWLYGPLSIGKDKISPSPSASPADTKLQIYKTKPILKKRSMSEMMLQKSLSTSSLLKQATAVIESQQFIRLYPPSRPDIVAHANSTNSSLSCRSNLSSLLNTSDITSAYSTGCQSPATKRHIHFNDQVQQCIALETDDSDYIYEKIYREDDSYNEEKKPAEPNSTRHGFERKTYNEPQTIAHLPSTTLKFNDEPPKRKGYSLNSIFVASKPPTSPPPPTDSLAGSSYLSEDDEEMADLDWEPNRRFSNRQNSIPKTPSPRNGTASSNLEVDTFQLPNFNSWDDENPPTAGLLGRAVDAVNTARDIAHVLWNVGWRR